MTASVIARSDSDAAISPRQERPAGRGGESERPVVVVDEIAALRSQ